MNTGFSKIGIIGGGKMGTSLFNHLLNYNLNLVWLVRSQAVKMEKKFQRKLKRELKNGLISNHVFDEKTKTVCITDNIEKLANCDLLIECISENLSAKRTLINTLLSVVSDKTIIATNSSSILPQQLCDNENLLNRLIGIHFFYPVNLKPMTELVYQNFNTKKTIQKCNTFLGYINKKVILQTNSQALILNRLMLGWQALAFNYCTDQNISFELADFAIDKYLFPIGIFEMMDHIGLDIIYEAAQNYELINSSQINYHPLIEFLKLKVSANQTGIKKQIGFKDYSKSESNTDFKNILPLAKELAKSYFSVYNWTIKNRLCSEQELNDAMNEYLDTKTEDWHNL